LYSAVIQEKPTFEQINWMDAHNCPLVIIIILMKAYFYEQTSGFFYAQQGE
jgi:hypothetical protein